VGRKTLLQVEGATKIYRQGQVEVPALRGVDLHLERGAFAALVGSSGSGKTTLLNLIGALDRPTSGRIVLEGKDLGALSASARARLRRDRIGFVFQAYNLIPVLTAFENAEMVLALQKVPRDERRRRVLGLLREVGLTGLEHRRPDQLSGGQQQRVAIARAVAPNPALVLADEPTANVDSHTAERLLDLMQRMNEQDGVTFLFSTHDPRVIRRARRVIRLRDGRVEADEVQGGAQAGEEPAAP